MTPAVLALDAAGIDYSIHEYEGSGELANFGLQAARALNLAEDQVFKTLMVLADDELLVAVLPVSCQLSMKLVASAVRAKKASLSDPARAERSSGYVVGGISPIGQRKKLRTVIDETAELFDVIYVSGGRRGMDIAIAPADLIELVGAVVLPIATGPRLVDQ